MRNGQRRNAVTLMEVLVATFILSIGLISVIAMFPVGAKNMVDSIKNERTAQAAHNFDAMMRVVWKDLHVNPDGSLRQSTPSVFINFDQNLLGTVNIAGDPNGPSFPILLDPLGYTTQGTYNSANHANYIGGRTDFVQRISYTGLTTQLNLRFACLPDDMSFSPNGEPVVAGGQLDRGYRYNVAYMLQRPVNSNIYEANLWVLAFDGRPYNDVAAMESVFESGVASPTLQTIDSSTVRIDYSTLGEKPALKKGGYVMVTSLVNYTYLGVPTQRWHVDFVRVTASTDVSSTVMELGFERPVNVPSSTQYRVVIFQHLAEVFTRGKVSPNIGQVW